MGEQYLKFLPERGAAPYTHVRSGGHDKYSRPLTRLSDNLK